MLPSSNKEQASSRFAILIYLGIAVLFLIFTCTYMHLKIKEAESELDLAKQELQLAQNNLVVQESIEKNEVREYTIVSTGMDSNRVAADLKIALEYFTPAFTWDSGASYDQARAFYTADLGEDHNFLETLMPPNIYLDQYNYVDLNDLNSKLQSIESNVIDIEEGTYSYIAVVSITSTANLESNGEKSQLSGQGYANVILMYSVNTDGEVTDIGAWTTF